MEYLRKFTFHENDLYEKEIGMFNVNSLNIA